MPGAARRAVIQASSTLPVAMVGQVPEISVVVATRDRPRRLAALLRSLEEQTLPREAFEVIVVDDASSSEGTAHLLALAERDHSALVIRRARPGGPAGARNEGWRVARAPLVAFTDDDCEAAPDWLERAVAAAAAHPGAIVQGRTDPIPEEAHRQSPFSRTRVVHAIGPPFETCNIVYPRDVLEALGGFDEGFRSVGEDTDLAWRANARGVPAVFVPEARVFHAVVQLGPVGMLRDALRWEHAVPLYVKHPDLRRAQLHRGIFWSPTHAQLALFLLALPLARRLPLVALVLARPYLVRLMRRRTGPLLAPYIMLQDLVETYAIVRGAIRNRTLVL